MYRLEQVHLVQFYLVAAETLQLARSSAIIAPNGSGKSAFLDAIQIALLGGDGNAIELNAQSGGSHDGRSIRAYCLGYYSDQEHVRDHATTYITLVFRDSRGARPPVSAGIALGASVDDPRHQVHGLFIFPGVALELDDHLDRHQGADLPLDWSTFRQAGVERAKAAGETPVIESRASRYVDEMLFRLRPDGARNGNRTAFTKAFKNALNLKKIPDTSEFVREKIAEDRPLSLDRFREQLDSFRSLRAKIAEVIERIGRADTVQAACAKAAQLRMHAAGFAAMAAEYRRDQHFERMDAAQARTDEATQALEQAERQHAATQHEEQQADSALRAQLARQNEHPELAAGADADEERRQRLLPLKTSLARALRRINEAFGKAQQLEPGLGAWALLARPWAQLLQRIESTDAIQALQLVPDAETLRLGEGLSTLRPLLAAADERAHTQTEQAQELKRRLRTVSDDLARAAQGKAQLAESVQHVRRALEDRGIEATPACDLARVSDPSWAPAIEAYLRGNVQALLVEAGREDEAIAIYESIPAGYNVYGVKIVQPDRARVDLASLPQDALARLVEGTHPVAVAFLQSRLRRLRRLAKAASRSEEGLTSSGMLVSNGTVERLRLPAAGEVLLGHTDFRARRDRLARSKQQLEQELDQAERGARRARELHEALRPLATLDATLDDIASWLRDHAEAEQQLALREAARQAALSPDLIALQEAIAAAAERYETAKRALLLAVDERGKRRNAAEEAQRQLDRLSQDSSGFEHAATTALCAPYVDAGWIDAKRTEIESGERPLAELIAWCEQRAAKERERYIAEESHVRGELGGYASAYAVSIDFDPSDVDAVARMIAAELTRLRESELASYQRQADDAYATAVRTFRSRIAAQLRNNFDDLNRQIRTLNQVLEKSPAFTNDERYHFRKTVAPEHKRLFDFINLVADRGEEDSLFDDPVQAPEEFRALLEDATQTGTRSVLEDYRRFFSFDVEVRRDGRTISTLGARMRSGSGGEHRAPLFVVAGAALAAAYGKMDGDDSGLSLILLDELGDKIDEKNTRAVFEYLHSLGLQPLVAAPETALGAVSASLEGYIQLYRAEDVLMLQHVRLAPGVRTLLDSDSCIVHPELLEAEVAAVLVERGSR